MEPGMKRKEENKEEERRESCLSQMEVKKEISRQTLRVHLHSLTLQRVTDTNSPAIVPDRLSWFRGSLI